MALILGSDRSEKVLVRNRRNFPRKKGVAFFLDAIDLLQSDLESQSSLCK